ncbi:hypothetical protein ACIQGZ_01565 [Streptomyces sp. NPDC092296]|uniref:hypothetical protein n=1 Tax=Streptomyces sp. NPDC092296 TaxID=3366012 RepID=UPI0037F1D22F
METNPGMDIGTDGHGHGGDQSADGDRLRYALATEAELLTVAPVPLARVVRRGRGVRARRRTAVALAVAAVVATPVALAVGLRGGAADPVDPVAAATVADQPSVGAAAAPGATAGRSAAPTVRVVAEGKRFAVGLGQRMYLTRSERCLVEGHGRPECKSVGDGNQQAGSVSLQTLGDSRRALYTPLYIGPARVARITVAVAGRTLDAQVVTLPGRPGYASGYVVGPTLDKDARPGSVVVTVYDQAGRIVARL